MKKNAHTTVTHKTTMLLTAGLLEYHRIPQTTADHHKSMLKYHRRLHIITVVTSLEQTTHSTETSTEYSCIGHCL